MVASARWKRTRDPLDSRYAKSAKTPKHRGPLHFEELEARITPAAIIDAITPSLALIGDADAGTASFALSVHYSADMSTASRPTILFPTEKPTTTLTLNNDASGWLDARTFVARYDVKDANVVLSKVDVSVTAARDSNSSIQIANLTRDVFSIDMTQNPGITLLESLGSTTAREGSSGDTVSVRLDSKPSAPVTIAFGTETGLICSPSSLVFTVYNWSQAKTLSVRAADDKLAQGNRTAELVGWVTTTDSAYQSAEIPTVAVNVIDNDTPGLVITQTLGTTMVVEGGTSDSYTVKLKAAPTADVTVHIATDAYETVSTSDLVFTSSNWSSPQTVTVTAIDNEVTDGLRRGAIVHTVISDSVYAGLKVPDLKVTVVDNDVPSFTIAALGDTAVPEGADPIAYSVKLNAAPTSNVTINLRCVLNRVTVSPSTLVLGIDNWKTPQEVSIAAKDDNIKQGTVRSAATGKITTLDAGYKKALAPSIKFSIIEVNGPKISTVAHQSADIFELAGSLPPIPFTVSDVDTPLSDLTFSATSSDLALVAIDGIAVTGTGKDRLLTITPAEGFVGVTTITLKVSDGKYSSSTTFDVQVHVDASLPYSDDFSWKTTGFLGYSWETQIGKFYDSGSVAVPGSGPLNLATLIGTVSASTFLQADVTLGSAIGSKVGLVARASGGSTGDYYSGQLVRTSAGIRAEIWKSIAGVPTRLAGATVAASSGTLLFEVDGESLRLSLDEALVVETTDIDISDGLMGVLATSGSTLDNFYADDNFADGGQLLSYVYAHQYQDGFIDRDEMLEIFARAETSPSLSESDYYDLLTVVYNLEMPDYVADLGQKVVAGDNANENYQGQPLGYLQPSDPTSKLAKLVDKWFYGKDHPVAQSSYTLASPSIPLFDSDGPNYWDIAQGSVGDCWLLASLGTVAFRTPAIIQDMFIDNGDGTYTVKFYYDGSEPSYLTVDRYLPSGTDRARTRHSLPAGGTSDEMWVALAEKAYAQFNESGGVQRDWTNSYAGLENGGTLEAVPYLTGQIPELDFIDVDNSADLVSQWDRGDYIAISSFSSFDSPDPAIDANGVVTSHQYVMIGYDSATQKFKLFNPWGLDGGVIGNDVAWGVNSLMWDTITESFSHWANALTGSQPTSTFDETGTPANLSPQSHGADTEIPALAANVVFLSRTSSETAPAEVHEPENVVIRPEVFASTSVDANSPNPLLYAL